jgi:hypothetical protein
MSIAKHDSDGQADDSSRYIHRFYYGELGMFYRDLALEQKLGLENSQYGALRYLAEKRFEFATAGAPITKDLVVKLVKFKEAIKNIKQALLDKGVRLSKDKVKKVVYSRPA